MQRGMAVLAVGVFAALMAPAGAEEAPGLPNPQDPVVAALRQVCDLQWIDGVCEATGYPDPQYVTNTDPSPSNPLALRVGVLHEHSGYSDGDPDTRPSDYFAAARTGHNVADAGGDTGVIIDYLLSSEHSENEKLPITTAMACLDTAGIPAALAALDVEGILPPLKCSNLDRPSHWRKWDETLAQAADATDMTGTAYTGFTGMRGFEYTNDIWNHLGVYFGRNVVNAKIDGSYLLPNQFWAWLREPAGRGRRLRRARRVQPPRRRPEPHPVRRRRAPRPGPPAALQGQLERLRVRARRGYPRRAAWRSTAATT